MSRDDWGTYTSIASAFLNKATISKEYSIRYQERISRAEIEELKRKFNIISLSVAITLVVIVAILIVVQNQLEIFNEPYIIPVIMIPILVILIAIGITEFFLIKKYGYKALEQKLGTLEQIESELKEWKKRDTKKYLITSEAFEKVQEIETESKLPGFLLSIIISEIEMNEDLISKNELYKYLFILSVGKEKIFRNEIKKNEVTDEAIKEIKIQNEIFKECLEEFSKIEKTPLFFKTRSEKILENLRLLGQWLEN